MMNGLIDPLRPEAKVAIATCRQAGIPDAPALKQADLGVAMGIKGTVYANILRFVHDLFSCNLAEILVVFTALLIGWPVLVGPLHILWLNMITDVFPALSLALEPSAPDAMKRPPRDPREPLTTSRYVPGASSRR